MKRLLSLFLLSAFLGQAHADLLVEPVLGYNIGSGEYKDKNTGNTTDLDANGVGFGGRLGFQKLGIQVGLDYLASSLDLGDDDFKDNLSTSEWGAFVGYEFPVLIRLYAGYVFSANGDTKTDTGNQKVEWSEGSGTKFGLGFTGLPIIDINLEYRMISYDKVEVGGDKQNYDADYSAVMLSLSAPFTF